MASEHDEPAREHADAMRRADDLRALLDALPLATAVKDREGRLLYVNAAAAAGYGRSPAELIGRHERELMPPGNDLEGVLAADREVIDSGRAQGPKTMVRALLR